MIKAGNNSNSAREAIHFNASNITVQGIAPRMDWSEMHESKHFVQFYEADSSLLDSLNGFISTGLSAGEASIVVATEARRQGLEQRLQASGLNVEAAIERGQYVSLDAAETLSKFIVDGSPEPRRFTEVIGEILARATKGHHRVRVFGEMVALLWADGNHNAAIRLEELWNNLQETHSFSLFCAYPMRGLGGEALAEPLGSVCATHSSVIPAESYSAIDEPDARLRAIALLQQKALSLEAEIAERKEAEETIRLLLRISERLNSTLDLDALLDHLVVEAVSLVRAESGVAGLHTSEGMVCHKYFQKGEWLPLEYCWPPMHGLPGWLIVNKVPYITNDAMMDTQIVHELCEQFGVHQALSTPVFSTHGEVLGFFEIHNKKDGSVFTLADQERLMAVSQVAAIAIQNAMAYSEIRRAERERTELLAREQVARARAEEASRLKDEFLATVSHELRTPLNAIMGWSHMLRTGNLDQATIARAVETIQRNAQSQAQLIEDILDVSRVITGKLRLHIGPVDVASVINAAIDSVQLAADSKGIQLEVTLDPSARHISGDSNRLQQVVWNLLSNAIKFTPADGHISVRLERAGSHVQICVSDTGCGVSPDFLPFIFDRFRQADGTSTRRHGGLGLGLAIVRHLVEIHGGTVSADSAGEGCGATFTIRFPLPEARERARSRMKEAESLLPDKDMLLKSLASLNGVQVLLVDDDADSLQVIAAMLNEQGANVQTAASAAEAIEVLQWYRPDVIVSDLAMPEEDGYSLIGKVRAKETESGEHIPVVALTAYVRVEDRARALAAGFNMFVPKPVEPSELIMTIANLAEASTTKYGHA